MAHLELLVEEPSMEAFLRTLLPRLLAPGFTFEVHVFQGKRDLLSKLSARLRGYQRWLPPDYRLVVLVDQDDDDCRVLKKRLEHAATTAGLASRTQVGNQTWKVATRVVIEELEAWYFGDWDAVRAACDPKFADYAIYEHCLPFNVSRAYDEARGIDTPRIWTAARDIEMWEGLQG